MEVADRHPSSDYALGPPWLFRGSALYQLHLVKADTARAFIPKNLKLVEAFGYTLGGFFLAHYDGSPAGIFDELVVIAGIVWNPPTSCAWAARVLVNSDEACKHGQKEIGLPSHVGTFSKRAKEMKGIHIDKPSSFLDTLGLGSSYRRPKLYSDIQVSEIKSSSPMTLCNISLPFVASNKWMGPAIRVSLPSFSGETIHSPHLLKYSCHIECRVRPVEAAKILGPSTVDPDKCSNGFEPDDGSLKASNDGNPKASFSEEDDAWNRSISVLLSKPILALEFSLLKMQVDAPTVLLPHT